MPRRLEDPGSFAFTCGGYTIQGTPAGLPSTYGALRARAQLADEYHLNEPGLCCVTVTRSREPWPILVVAQSCDPVGSGFEPGICLVPETQTVFIGAGQRLLAYRLDAVTRLWEDSADTGFLRWDQRDATILLSAELELAAWDIGGRKLWTTFVEPPWHYSIAGSTIDLDVMGIRQSFDLRTGPAAARR